MTEKFFNPIIPKGADPFFTYYDGNYYYVYSTADGLHVSKADNIHHMRADGASVFVPESGREYSKELWAPEIHCINGEWYLYVAADGGNNDDHRMYVLKSESGKPDGQYKMLGKICDRTDLWAIDGTVIQKDGELYFVWSGWPASGEKMQNIYIAKMKSPTEICSDRVLLSTPEYEWEKRGSGPLPSGRVLPPVNEGPQILYKDGTIHIIYSASGSWCRHYCLGRLTYRGGDILSKDSWEKCDSSVFSESNGTHGTGHCSFVRAVDGVTDFIVYHACIDANGGWSGRSVRAQSFVWDKDIPVFGKAAEPTEAVEIPIR